MATETINEFYNLTETFPQLHANRAATLAAIEAAGLYWMRYGDRVCVTVRNAEQRSALLAAMKDNRTRDGIWPFCVRGYRQLDAAPWTEKLPRSALTI
jgi:hypothetical protein